MIFERSAVQYFQGSRGTYSAWPVLLIAHLPALGLVLGDPVPGPVTDGT